MDTSSLDQAPPGSPPILASEDIETLLGTFPPAGGPLPDTDSMLETFQEVAPWSSPPVDPSPYGSSVQSAIPGITPPTTPIYGPSVSDTTVSGSAAPEPACPLSAASELVFPLSVDPEVTAPMPASSVFVISEHAGAESTVDAIPASEQAVFCMTSRESTVLEPESLGPKSSIPEDTLPSPSVPVLTQVSTAIERPVVINRATPLTEMETDCLALEITRVETSPLDACSLPNTVTNTPGNTALVHSQDSPLSASSGGSMSDTVNTSVMIADETKAVNDLSDYLVEDDPTGTHVVPPNSSELNPAAMADDKNVELIIVGTAGQPPMDTAKLLAKESASTDTAVELAPSVAPAGQGQRRSFRRGPFQSTPQPLRRSPRLMTKTCRQAPSAQEGPISQASTEPSSSSATAPTSVPDPSAQTTSGSGQETSLPRKRTRTDLTPLATDSSDGPSDTKKARRKADKGKGIARDQSNHLFDPMGHQWGNSTCIDPRISIQNRQGPYSDPEQNARWHELNEYSREWAKYDHYLDPKTARPWTIFEQERILYFVENQLRAAGTLIGSKSQSTFISEVLKNVPSYGIPLVSIAFICLDGPQERRNVCNRSFKRSFKPNLTARLTTQGVTPGLPLDWWAIAREMPSRSSHQCEARWGATRGKRRMDQPLTEEDRSILRSQITCQLGTGFCAAKIHPGNISRVLSTLVNIDWVQVSKTLAGDHHPGQCADQCLSEMKISGPWFEEEDDALVIGVAHYLHSVGLDLEPPQWLPEDDEELSELTAILNQSFVSVDNALPSPPHNPAPNACFIIGPAVVDVAEDTPLPIPVQVVMEPIYDNKYPYSIVNIIKHTPAEEVSASYPARPNRLEEAVFPSLTPQSCSTLESPFHPSGLDPGPEYGFQDMPSPNLYQQYASIPAAVTASMLNHSIPASLGGMNHTSFAEPSPDHPYVPSQLRKQYYQPHYPHYYHLNRLYGPKDIYGRISVQPVHYMPLGTNDNGIGTGVPTLPWNPWENTGPQGIPMLNVYPVCKEDEDPFPSPPSSSPSPSSSSSSSSHANPAMSSTLSSSLPSRPNRDVAIDRAASAAYSIAPEKFKAKVVSAGHRLLLSRWAEQVEPRRALVPYLPSRKPAQAQAHWTEALNPGVLRGGWSIAEEWALKQEFENLGPCWIAISDRIQGRTQRQCRSRWIRLYGDENHADKIRGNRRLKRGKAVVRVEKNEDEMDADEMEQF
ncbi:hypothetical protein BGW38_003757 [Lunasporangiospora selenospora]|uniref:Myb-like DNA-binding domain-containing protein n=1 Tax=Lunasporangiospora selenospora TaxID=979761 RepID=A0A9P6FQQ6_9FUNG|nr:hypothetical protein BGW38_003757 [Lunasporangiospora selenospora]